MAVSMEHCEQQVFDMPGETIDIEKSSNNVHIEMKKILSNLHYKIYKILYIDGKTEEECAKIMGYKSSEKNRMSGYASISNAKRTIIQKAKKLLSSGDVDIV